MRLRTLVDAASYAACLLPALALGFVASLPAFSFAQVLPVHAMIFSFVVAFVVSGLLYWQLATALAKRTPDPVSMSAWRSGEASTVQWLPHFVRCALLYVVLLYGIMLLVAARDGVYLISGTAVIPGAALAAILVDVRLTITGGWQRRRRRHPLGGVRDSTG